MKKILLTIAVIITTITTKAQSDTTFYVTPGLDNQEIHLCVENYNRAIIYAMVGCDQFWWSVNGSGSYDNSIILDYSSGSYFAVHFNGYGCGYNILFDVMFFEPNIPNETTTELWKRPFETLGLESVGIDSIGTGAYEFNYSFLWSTGETTYNIDVAEPGTYTCEITSPCSSVTRTFVVRDNVEIYRSTVDLATNLNKVTWQVTEEQAGYINQVKVERDGFVVGMAPYQDGQFLDAIGSENAARNYRLTGILYDGTECPIPSYQKGTTHVDYSPNANNPSKLNLAWTPPYIEEGAPVSIAYFQICKYDPESNEITVIDQIGANNTIASYNNNLFEGGYAVLGVLFNESKDNENISFSNLSEEVLGVGDQTENRFMVYPNPSNGVVTIEGTGRLTVMNLLGQEVLTQEIERKTTLEIPKGIYFMKLGSIIHKVVVE